MTNRSHKYYTETCLSTLSFVTKHLFQSQCLVMPLRRNLLCAFQMICLNRIKLIRKVYFWISWICFTIKLHVFIYPSFLFLLITIIIVTLTIRQRAEHSPLRGFWLSISSYHFKSSIFRFKWTVHSDNYTVNSNHAYIHWIPMKPGITDQNNGPKRKLSYLVASTL